MADQAITVDYDRMADVLYLSVGEPTPRALSDEDELGLIWRRSPEGECLGVTVPDFRYGWTSREAELVRLISANLHIPRHSVEDQVQVYA